ncbi:MAG: hypothetical protein R3Y43_06790 [Alphaproteobacteria bacterium]
MQKELEQLAEILKNAILSELNGEKELDLSPKASIHCLGGEK